MIGATIDFITLTFMRITLRFHIFLYAYFSVPVERWFLLYSREVYKLPNLLSQPLFSFA